MTFPSIQNSFVAGELTPAVFGRTDLSKWHNGASTMRNCFVDYKGGALSRAGLAYVGTCKQPGNAAPPRDINFQFSIDQGYALEFGDHYMRIKSNGAYVIEGTKAITGATRANPAVLTIPAHGYVVGDWVFITGMAGMTNFDGLTWIVHTVPDANHVTLTDLFGNVVDSTGFNAYTSGGTAARIYTVVAPYAAVDLPYLKFTQSADTMTLDCVNQITGAEYPSYELVRSGATSWAFTQDVFNSSIAAPTNLACVPESSTTVDTWYSYRVTAVDLTTGDESVGSTPAAIKNNNISINAGSNILNWTPVTNAAFYNVYRATPSFNVPVATGSQYSFIGQSFGPTFTDTNIVADATRSSPIHENPFAPGQILDVMPTAFGTLYTQATIGYNITTTTGSGFLGFPVVVNGQFVGFVIENNGQKYAPTDTIHITDSGSGTGATAKLFFGAQSGTYPGVPAYFQERRVYGYSLNAPDTYDMSQPGSYNNFDKSTPTIDSDAITGTPWAQQINGIQFMVPMPGGLVILTGKGAWQLTGGSSAAITPSNQTAIPQAYNGCSAIVPPVVVNYDILYVQSKGSIVRDLAYNFFANIYTGTDTTVLSSHLFDNYQLLQWAYAEEPFKIIWAVRNDGVMLSLTYLKEQDVYAWARHDTNGQFVGVCSVTEPPVDAVYCIVKRYVQGAWRYYSERMDNRNWQNVEQCYCVDAGLQWPMTQPNATLTVSAATGNVTLTASSSVFTGQNVGDIVRAGGGKITITGFTSGTLVNGMVTQDITATVPNDPSNMPVPAVSGTWLVSVPTSVVTGLNHLEGLTVAILADGSVVPNQTVVNGTVTLPHACSAITIGLPYLPQLQTMYLDPSGQPITVQGKRKNIYAVTVRMEASRGMQVGTNQADSSVQPNNATVPWVNMKEFKQRNALINAGAAIPLFTGDERIIVPANWNTRGQIAVQQNYPLPMNCLAVIPEFVVGDTSG